jgi:hypothetical protein
MTADQNRVIDDAAILLFDKNLIWSSDMEDIKDSLGALLVSCKADEGILKLLAFTVASKIVYQDKTEVFGKIETRA